MTDDEKEIIDQLAKVWNLFISLPVEHPSDLVEFQTAIHSAQLLVMARLGRRIYNEEYNEK